MKTFNYRSTPNPLILNFMSPETHKMITAEEVAFVYDPQTQTTMYMGGGATTRSTDYSKKTHYHGPGTVGSDFAEHNDDIS